MVNSVKSRNTKHSWWNFSKAFFPNLNTRDSTEKIFLIESLLLALFFTRNISVVLLLVCVHAPNQWVSVAMQPVSEHCGRVDVSLEYACLFTDSGMPVLLRFKVQLHTVCFWHHSSLRRLVVSSPGPRQSGCTQSTHSLLALSRSTPHHQPFSTFLCKIMFPVTRQLG